MRKASDIAELRSSLWLNGLPHGRSTFKKAVRSAWRREFGDECQGCGCQMLFEHKHRSHERYATIDHITARSLGGSDKLENIQVICHLCNNGKSLDEKNKVESKE